MCLFQNLTEHQEFCLIFCHHSKLPYLLREQHLYHIIQYVGLCIFSIPTPLVMIENIYILCLIVMIKSEL